MNKIETAIVASADKLLARIARQVSHDRDTGCLVWTGGVQANGYARLSMRLFGVHNKLLVHRVACLLTTGKSIAGLQVDHRCCNRQCVNPAHLQAVSGRTNAHWRDERQGEPDADILGDPDTDIPFFAFPVGAICTDEHAPF